VRPGLDHLPQPHPLLVRRQVLDLVGDRPAIGLAHAGQHLQESLALDPDPQDRRRDLGHELGRQAQVLGLERRIARRLRPQRIEPRGQVAVRAVGLEQ
jgi:hypothetical protein